MARIDDERLGELHRATLDTLLDVGFDLLSMDLVAAAAHASKATLYRHWPNKEALVVDALSALAVEHGPPADVPDTGSLRSDLHALVRGQSGEDSDIELVTAVIHACRSHPELARLLRENVVATQTASLDVALQRGVDRGEVDPDSPALRFVLVALVGPKLLRTVVDGGEQDETSYLLDYVDAVVLPALLRPPPA